MDVSFSPATGSRSSGFHPSSSSTSRIQALSDEGTSSSRMVSSRESSSNYQNEGYSLNNRSDINEGNRRLSSPTSSRKRRIKTANRRRQSTRNSSKKLGKLCLHRMQCILGCVLALTGCVLVLGQRDRRPDEAMPPGLVRWLGKDECDSDNRWIEFYHGFSAALQKAQSGEIISQEVADALATDTLPQRNLALYAKDQSAIGMMRNLTDHLVADPNIAFQCGTAMAAAFSMLSTLYDSVNLPVLSLRANQHASIYGSFDFQMKGEAYIDESPWPITWKQSVEQALKRMDKVQKIQRAREWRQTKLPRRPEAPKLKILIVSVCEYNNDHTPLYSLSYWNKKRYAVKHGHELVVHQKSPLLQDPFAGLFMEPKENRPPAWGKIDAVLMALREDHDWVMWMDCDSYFMDSELGIHELIDFVLEKEKENEPPKNAHPADERPLKEFLKEWDSSDGSLESFDRLLASGGDYDHTNIGWDSWLMKPTVEKNGEKRIELICSEDGLMLNTGIFFTRTSLWSWRFFQKVRRFTFGPKAPITQHPWWEQTAMVYLIQVPFASENNWAMAPAVSLLDQKHINPYPPLVSSALLTHVAFEDSDYIISFSGCKIYSSQDVCNALFLNYFAQSVEDYKNIPDQKLQDWLEKGRKMYR